MCEEVNRGEFLKVALYWLYSVSHRVKCFQGVWSILNISYLTQSNKSHKGMFDILWSVIIMVCTDLFLEAVKCNSLLRLFVIAHNATVCLYVKWIFEVAVF